MSESIRHDDPAALAHLAMLQGVINRMAGNSALCKSIGLTLVIGMITVTVTAQAPHWIPLTYLPLVIFAYLDILYLVLERGYRKAYNDFVTDLHQGKLTSDKLFSLHPPAGYRSSRAFLDAAKSWSVWLVYIPVGLMIFALSVTQGAAK